MGYFYLATAIILELIGTTALKYADGFSKIVPTATTIISYIVSFFFVSKAMQYFTLSLVYATWSGVGVVAATVISVVIFKEEINCLGISGVLLVVIGLLLLNFYGTTS